MQDDPGGAEFPRFPGTLQGSEIVIAGRVMGTVIGTRHVSVTSTGKVAGTIATRHLAADDHSLIDGEIHILNEDGTISPDGGGGGPCMPKYRPGE